MRIISKEHDYYDRAMGQGHDDTTRFVRVRCELAATPLPLKSLMERISNSFHYDLAQTRSAYHVFEPFAIAFCGKLYRGIKAVKLRKRTSPNLGLDHDVSIFYHWSDLEQYLSVNKITVPRQPFFRSNTPFERVAESFLTGQGTGELTKFLLDERIVILTCSEKNRRYWINGDKVAQCYPHAEYLTVIDDPLGHHGFGQIFDAYSAYQEIDMYVSGTLANPAPTALGLSEKDRIAQHGFDEWSFRRPPRTAN